MATIFLIVIVNFSNETGQNAKATEINPGDIVKEHTYEYTKEYIYF